MCAEMGHGRRSVDLASLSLPPLFFAVAALLLHAPLSELVQVSSAGVAVEIYGLQHPRHS